MATYSRVLFPACAGVILLDAPDGRLNESVPRVCGGDPTCDIANNARRFCSPRVRG